MSTQTKSKELNFIRFDDDLQERVRRNMRDEDATSPLLSLTMAAIAAHEMPFHWPDASKAEFMERLALAFDAGLRREHFSFTFAADDETVSFAENRSYALTAAYAHAAFVPGAQKEPFMAFMSEAWDAGVAQRKVYRGEEEGCIMNDFGLAMSFACGIAMHGKEKGLLPETTLAATA